jgi:hypothetical protein
MPASSSPNLQSSFGGTTRRTNGIGSLSKLGLELSVGTKYSGESRVLIEPRSGDRL